uniref:Uncharacterized protein n=1 Tax=Hucho hucho TaxID=62062 RepID=A0A4W5LB23_9TELE
MKICVLIGKVQVGPPHFNPLCVVPGIPSVCKQVVSVETTRDIPWAMSNCTLGFQVFGLWPDGSDGTDINAVSRSNEKRLLVTGDDFGKVHLFSFPCSQFRVRLKIY